MTANGCQLLIRGVTADNGPVAQVQANGLEVKATEPNFAQWEVTITKPAVGSEITARAADAAGNAEPTPHRLKL